jgi:hypothetical protein
MNRYILIVTQTNHVVDNHFFEKTLTAFAGLATLQALHANTSILN